MSKIITPLLAEVVLVGGIKDGQFGQYRSVLFKSDDGSEIWKSFKPDAEELRYLSSGVKVRLIPSGSTKSGKPSHVIELLDSSPNAPAPPKSGEQSRPNLSLVTNLSDDQKRQAASYVTELAALYRYCYGEASKALQGMVQTEESVRAAASSLFIQVVRKHNL